MILLLQIFKELNLQISNYITYAMSLLHVFLSLSLSLCMVVLIFVSFGYAIIY